MRNIMDFDGNREQIAVNNDEEFKKLIPILNLRFRGWKEEIIGGNYPLYIILEGAWDGHTNIKQIHKSVIQASEYYTEQECISNIFN